MLFNPWALLGALLFFLTSLFGAFHFGTSYEAGQQARAQHELLVSLQAEKDARSRDVQQARDDAAGKAAGLELQLLQARAKVRTVVQTITKEVPIYVTTESDARCTIPNGFVSLWNGSVGGPGVDGNPAAPASPGVVLDAPSGVALSAVAEAAIANHGAYWAVVGEVRARDQYIAALLDYINQIRKAVQ